MSKPATFTEAVARLSKPVPAKFIKQKPDKSRADYVAHHLIRQWLHIMFDDHRFETLQVVDKGEGQVAMRVRLTVMLGGEERHYEGWGESENRKAPYKSAESDAVKRIAAMHLGLGLHLWAREHYFLHDALQGQVEEAVQQAAARDAAYGGDDDEVPADEDVQTAGADAPPSSDTPPSEPPEASVPASITDKQRKRIFAQLGDLGIDDAGRKAILAAWYDGRSMTELTALEADEFYKRLTIADGQRAARAVAGVSSPPPESDGGGEAPEGSGGDQPTEEYSWRAHAGRVGLSSVEVLRAVREAWPTNSEWNKPARTKEIDAAVEKGGGAIVQAAIDAAAGKVEA